MSQSKILVLTLVLFCFAGLLRAQSDTIQYRTLRGTLGDSTVLSYRFGEIGLKQVSSNSYLGFATYTSTSDPETQFLVTSPFLISSDFDSISFVRVVNFDDGSSPTTDIDMTTSSSARDSVVASWVDFVKGQVVKPNSTYFSSSSSFKYILEIRRADNNALVLAVDTATCYTNGSNALRFITTGNTPSHVAVGVGSGHMGTYAYLQVRIVKSLPYGSTVSYEAIEYPLQNPTSSASNCGFYQDNCSEPSPKISDGLLNPVDFSFSIRNVFVDGLKLICNLRTKGVGRVQCSISNVLGRDVASSVFTASNQLQLDVGKLLPGPYFVRVADGEHSQTSKLIIH